jgi:phosphatidylglycerol:prolipoprotein diacylglycerol transferase
MYPDLSYVAYKWFGTEPDNWLAIFKTFGLLLVISILVAAWLLYKELKRKQEEGVFKGKKIKVIEGKPASVGEIVGNGLFGFLVGFKLVYLFTHFDEFQRDASDVLLSTKGTLWAGFLFGLVFAGYKYWEKNRKKLPKPVEKTHMMYPHDRIGDITIIAAITGIIGAKIFAIIEDLESFFQAPMQTFFSGSGLAIYGGLIGGFLGVFYYLRRHKIPFWQVADAIAPALIISYGIGRIGCQLSGDGDWGIIAAAQPGWWFLPDWLWSFDYPNNVAYPSRVLPEEGVVAIEGCNYQYCTKLEPKVYPTPLYETIMALIIGAILWVIRKRVVVTGSLFALYLILNGMERYLIEFIRVNIEYNVLGIPMTQAQIIAAGMMLAGILCYLYLRQQHKKGLEKAT